MCGALPPEEKLLDKKLLCPVMFKHKPTLLCVILSTSTDKFKHGPVSEIFSCKKTLLPYSIKTLYDSLLWPFPKYLFWATNMLKKISVFLYLPLRKH